MDRNSLPSTRGEEQPSPERRLPDYAPARHAGDDRNPPQPREIESKNRRPWGRLAHLLVLLLVTIGSLALFIQSDRSGAYFSDHDVIEGNRITMGESFPTREAEELATLTAMPTPRPTAVPAGPMPDPCEASAAGCQPTAPPSAPADTAVPPTDSPAPKELPPTPTSEPAEPTPAPNDDPGEPTPEATPGIEPGDGEDESGETQSSQPPGVRINITP